MRIFGSCFVDYAKNEGTSDADEKSRLIIKGVQGKPNILTHAPTVQRASLKLLLAIAVADENFSTILRDVKQAYVQCEDIWKRLIFICSPAKLDYPTDNFLRQSNRFMESQMQVHICFGHTRTIKRSNLVWNRQSMTIVSCTQWIVLSISSVTVEQEKLFTFKLTIPPKQIIGNLLRSKRRKRICLTQSTPWNFSMTLSLSSTEPYFPELKTV